MAQILFVTGIILSIAALLTIIPSPGASKKNLIGYKSKCSWTPTSTVILAVIAAGVFFARSLFL